MVRFRALFLALIAAACAPAAPTEAPDPGLTSGKQQTAIWIGDSLDSFVYEGHADDLAVDLITHEHNVVIRNLSSPGTTLGLTNGFGFNTDWTTQAFGQICGGFKYCQGIVITAGVNDYGVEGVTWAMVEASLVRMLDWAQAQDVKVLMADLIWSTAAETNASPNMGLSWAEYRAHRAAVCARYSVCRFAPRPPEFDTEHPDLYAATEREAGALVHLNPAGQRVRADWLGEAGENWVW